MSTPTTTVVMVNIHEDSFQVIGIAMDVNQHKPTN